MAIPLARPQIDLVACRVCSDNVRKRLCRLLSVSLGYHYDKLSVVYSIRTAISVATREHSTYYVCALRTLIGYAESSYRVLSRAHHQHQNQHTNNNNINICLEDDSGVSTRYIHTYLYVKRATRHDAQRE